MENNNFWKYLRRPPALQCINKYGKHRRYFGLIIEKFGSNFCALFSTNLESESIKIRKSSHCAWIRNFVVVEVWATKDPCVKIILYDLFSEGLDIFLSSC